MTSSTFEYERFCDDLGPEKVIHLHDAAAGLRAIVVVDNVACGASLGGVRMAADVTTEGAVHDPDGIDVEELIAAKAASGSVTGYTRGRKIANEEFFVVPCDILIPAARPDCIHENNVEGANIPVTAEAEARLHERGVLCVPDFIANAGGVIFASVEFHGGAEPNAVTEIVDKIGHNTRKVLEAAQAQGITPRAAAMALATERVEEAMTFRRRWG